MFSVSFITVKNTLKILKGLLGGATGAERQRGGFFFEARSRDSFS